MTPTQIRFTATEPMMQAMAELKGKLKFMSDAEIFKLAFSRFYNEEMGYDENGFSPAFQKELDEAIADPEVEGPFEDKDIQQFLDSLKK